MYYHFIIAFIVYWSEEESLFFSKNYVWNMLFGGLTCLAILRQVQFKNIHFNIAWIYISGIIDTNGLPNFIILTYNLKLLTYK
jgi:hypothetical protein